MIFIKRWKKFFKVQKFLDDRTSWHHWWYSFALLRQYTHKGIRSEAEKNYLAEFYKYSGNYIKAFMYTRKII
jgi:hypothetical protein